MRMILWKSKGEDKMTAIEIMMEEHENICRMLKVIRKECMGILKGDDINYEHFNMIIGFIRNYADGHHHNKEEIILFNRMVEHLGALGEKTIKNGMLVEHDLGRLYVNSLEEALVKVKSGYEEAKLDVIANAIGYSDLLERHKTKEDNVIYKFAERQLSKEIMEQIDKEALEYEEKNEKVKEENLLILKKLECLN